MKPGLVLERQEHTNKSIIGSIYYDGEFICYSLELPWNNNKVGDSCIPPGVYDLEFHLYKGHTETWALFGETVSHWCDNTKQRCVIVIHVANSPDELDGCIAVGLDKDTDWLIDSEKAFKKLKNVIISKNIDKITII